MIKKKTQDLTFSISFLHLFAPFQYKAHSIILGLSAPGLDWTAPVPPLTGLPEDVVQTTLHYLYAECLPQGLTETTARRCVKMVGKLPGFAKFGQLCETFLKNTALTQRKPNIQ